MGNSPQCCQCRAKRGAQRRAVAAIIEPSAHPEGGAEQRRGLPIRRQCRGGMLDRLRLGRVGLDEPAPESVGMTRRLEDDAAIDNRGGIVHPEADPSITAARCQGSITRPSQAA